VVRFFIKKMIKDYLREEVLRHFGFEPTHDQLLAVDAFVDFVLSDDAMEVLVLRGFAGTGKTSLVGAFVRTMEQLERPCVLMAPTGRAAKVFSLYAAHAAYTIHKRIYRQKSLDQDSIFQLNFNMLKQVTFCVDEASMISDRPDSSALRQSLLDDLIQFVYGGRLGCRLMLLGDTAQLPPVGESESPALSESVLRRYGLTPRTVTLTQIVRQKEASGILWNATRLRQLIDQDDVFDWPKVRFQGFADVRRVPGNELIDTLAECYHRHGVDDTMVVCRSNKRAIAYNHGIRVQILGREDELCQGDEVMIAKNNYFWKAQTDEPENASGAQGENGVSASALEFLANGDIGVVEHVRNLRELYGFSFADCTIRLPDYDDAEIDATVLLDTLHAEALSLTHEQQERLFQGVLEDYVDVPYKAERMKKLKQDAYFNALQIKYAYAVTCHKAQGGQWGHIFIDQGYVTDDMLGADYYRWLYTALTRATQTVYLVNWTDEQTID